MSHDLDEQAYEQQLQWSLAEVEGGEFPPDVTDKVMAAVHGDGQPSSTAIVRSRWLLTAAIVVLGVAALFGVHSLSRNQDNTQQTTSPPTQDPKRHVLPRPYHVDAPEDVAKLPTDARAVRVSMQGDDVVQAVATRCPKLEVLGVSVIDTIGDQVTDRVFAIAASLPELRELDLYVTKDVFGQNIKQLAALPRLESLTISSAQLRPEAYEVLTTLPSLRALDLSHNPDLDDEAMKSIVRCPGLQQLDISNCPKITAAGIAMVNQIPHLESLKMRRLKFSWKSLGGRGPKQLRRLDASNTNFRNEYLDWLPTPLSELDLSNTSADANTCRILTKLTPKLQKLNLSGCTITDVGIDMLDSLQDLRELDVTNSPFTRKGLQRFQKMDHLCVLKISGLDWLTEADIKSLVVAGIDLQITKGTRMEGELDRLRRIYSFAIRDRRERVMKR